MLGTQKRSVPMSINAETQGIIKISMVDDFLLTWMEAWRPAVEHMEADGIPYLIEDFFPWCLTFPPRSV